MNNDKLIDSILNKNHDEMINYKNNQNINEIKLKYIEELEGYEYIPTIEYFLNNCNNGGYIRYVNFNKNLKWGGILVKVSQNENNNEIIENNIDLILKNKTNKIYKINWRKNYIFYKKHKTSNDNLRELFISLIKN